jgi:hypothetical protein
MKRKTKNYTQKADYRVLKWATICGSREEPKEEELMASTETHRVNQALAKINL